MEKPLAGRGVPPIQAELARRISGFRVEAFFLHNTYLQIAVERGLVGLFLYLWVMFDLLRLARSRQACGSDSFLGAPFRRLWPLILMVYMINASFVGMNYQFVNGLLFTPGPHARRRQPSHATASAIVTYPRKTHCKPPPAQRRSWARRHVSRRALCPRHRRRLGNMLVLTW